MAQLTQKMHNIEKKWEKNAEKALTSHYANDHGDKWVKIQLITWSYLHTNMTKFVKYCKEIKKSVSWHKSNFLYD